VFPFGSVPLKTFLPDGDIDLTALSYQNEEEALARDICSILENDKQDSQFQVQDVQYVRAQVLFSSFYSVSLFFYIASFIRMSNRFSLVHAKRIILDLESLVSLRIH